MTATARYFPFGFVLVLAALLVTLLLFVLQGCASSPIAVAQTPEQKYAAVAVTYDAALAGVEAFIANPDVPQATRARVRDAAVASGPIYQKATAAYREFVAAKVAIEAAPATPAARFQVATDNLQHWLAELETAATSLKGLMHR